MVPIGEGGGNGEPAAQCEASQVVEARGATDLRCRSLHGPLAGG